MSKTISVALCTYNGAKYIREQLESIVNQTLLPTEIVVYDDKSTDNTLDIVSDFAALYSHIRWIIQSNKQNLGVRNNFAHAINRCVGDYIATADQDDIWEKEKLQTLYSTIETEHVALVHSDIQLIDSTGAFIMYTPPELSNKAAQLPLKYYLITSNNVTGCTCLFTSELIKLAQPFPQAYFYHDRWLAVVAYHNGGIGFVNQKLTRYRQHESNVVASLGGGGNTTIRNQHYFSQKATVIAKLLKQQALIKYSFKEKLLLWLQYLSGISGISAFRNRD